VTTMLVNDLVDTAGISYDYRITQDTGVSPVDAVRTYTATDAIFGIEQLWHSIRAAGLPIAVSDEMTLDTRRRRNQPIRKESGSADAADVGVAAR
jgi:glutamate dehydrogenase